jgi:hypothetical protein
MGTYGALHNSGIKNYCIAQMAPKPTQAGAS